MVDVDLALLQQVTDVPAQLVLDVLDHSLVLLGEGLVVETGVLAFEDSDDLSELVVVLEQALVDVLQLNAVVDQGGVVTRARLTRIFCLC